MDRISVDQMNFVDSVGRTRIFNGMNIDDKLIGDVFRYNLDEDFFEKYVSNGFNLIRLAVQWANIEPCPGVYNETYLMSIDNIFRLAERYGVYILLDMHQDLFSGFNGVGGGDGAPDWACLTDGIKPKPYRFVWAEAYMFGKWVHNCFDHFWNNDKFDGQGLQDRYTDLWQMLASRYGESPALFGYDLFNEPAPGSSAKKMILRLALSGVRQALTSKKIKRLSILSALFKKDSKLLLDSFPGDVIRDIVNKIDKYEKEFDLKYYSPFLNKIASSIRKVTPDGIFVIEQPYFCNIGVRFSAEPIEVNGKREPLQCFAPHAYDITVDTPLYKYADTGRVKAFFNEMRNSQLRLSVPAIVGEWGGCSDNKDTSWFGHADELLDYFDSNQWGQLYWDYHGDDMDAPLMQMLGRTYPVAVAGDILRYGRDSGHRTFTLEYESDGVNETVIYAHCPCTVNCNGKARIIKSYHDGASLIGIEAGKGKTAVVLTFD
ncbi:MAG: cellulase family glycosylhydrolase [Clostridiales bacterium]|nr:cellulase family glycosylhydrolase [Clostridiales bacterium]